MMEAEVGVMRPQENTARIAGTHQKPGERQGRMLL